MSCGEKHHLFEKINVIKSLNDIYILDRGYGHYNTVLRLIDLKKHFCIRFSMTGNFAKKVLSDTRKDIVLEWKPSEKEKENARKHGVKCRPIRVRATKVILKTGETELLISSLIDMQKYSTQDMKWLYQKRWVVEEGFKKLKPKMKVEYFGCRKSQGIYQEYYAHVFLMNIIAFIKLLCKKEVSRKTNHRRYKYNINWQNAFRLVRNCIVKLLSSYKPEKLLEQLIPQVLSSIVPFIPDKVSIRDMRHASKRGRINHYYK